MIRVGFIGTGWMGQALLGKLALRDDVEVTAICRRSTSKAMTLQPPMPNAAIERDPMALVWRDDVDAVFICSPNSFHGPQSIAALEAGKHVFCEKPCATRFSDFTRQIELERATGLTTFVDYILHFDRMEQRLAGMVADGAFGTVTQFQVNYRHPVNIAGSKAWKLDASIMGDAIGMGINHAISVIINAMASQARPAQVFATSMPAQVRAFEADPIWNVHIGFDNGATGFCFGNIDSANGYDAMHSLYGSKGAFHFDSIAERPNKVRYWSEAEGGEWIYPLQGHWPEDTTTPDSGNVIEHQTSECVAHFIEHVKAGTQSPLSFANSASIAEIGWASLMSAAQNRPISLPLDYTEAAAFFETADD